MNRSPLRYPGGKAKISNFIAELLDNAGQKKVYIEPFAGGAGVALDLLLTDKVEEIVINDYDKAIYSFWRAVLNETDEFVEKIQNTPITIEEWNRQKEIYLNQNKKYSLDLAFATFFLNRTNRSGILKAGPIGGKRQDGNYSLDARFNEIELVKRIKCIAKEKSRIKVYNKDIISFIKRVISKYDDAFVYFDPPYYNKGPELYRNFFTDKDHKVLSDIIKNEVTCEWIVTYDLADEIIELYTECEKRKFDINYSAVNGRRKSEILILKDANYISNIASANKLNLRKLDE